MSTPLVAYTLLERIEARTLFGLRFWDAYLARSVSNGLHLRAQRILQTDDANGTIATIERIGRAASGRQTPNGTIIFPELHSTLRLTSDAIAPHRLLIELEDRLQRYLPVTFTLPLPNANAQPLQSRGAGVAGSPLLRALPTAEEHGIFLYSAPGRPTPAAAATLYAQIVTGNNEAAGTKPPAAAFALVEVRDLVVSGHPARSYFGMTDRDGSLMLPLPYPIPDQTGDNATMLQAQQFKFNVQVYFQRDAQRIAPDSGVPLLHTLLSQTPVQIMTEVSNGGAPQITNVATLASTLRFGQPLVIRTKESESYLRIVV